MTELSHRGNGVSWQVVGSALEVELAQEPANEIGTTLLAELERLAAVLAELPPAIRAVVFHSSARGGFSAGADLRELYTRLLEVPTEAREEQLRQFLGRIHGVFSVFDAAPVPTVAVLRGVVFGGGLELALTCDLRIAEKNVRFAFPELRLGLIPGFGGIPRLRRNVGNALVRELLLTGRSIGAQRAHSAGLVGEVVGVGSGLDVSRRLVNQLATLDADASRVAKGFAKPLPRAELAEETERFVELFQRSVVQERLRAFVNDSGPFPYLHREDAAK